MKKRIFALFLAAGLLLACAACEGRPSGDDPPTGTAAPESLQSLGEPDITEDITAAPTTTPEASTAETSSPAQTRREIGKSASQTNTTVSPSKTRPDVTMTREIKQDGLVLRVFTGYQHQFMGEPFILTVSITNTTGKDIIYGAWGKPDTHQDIPVAILGNNGGGFIDLDTWRNEYSSDYRIVTLKAGETFTETINFLPGTSFGNYQEGVDLASSPGFNWFPAGEYLGAADFTYYTGTRENPGERKHLQLEFPVLLI